MSKSWQKKIKLFTFNNIKNEKSVFSKHTKRCWSTCTRPATLKRRHLPFCPPATVADLLLTQTVSIITWTKMTAAMSKQCYIYVNSSILSHCTYTIEIWSSNKCHYTSLNWFWKASFRLPSDKQWYGRLANASATPCTQYIQVI